MRQNEFNGWTNYETWQANLWIGEAGGLYDDDMDAEMLEELLHEMVGAPETGLAADLFNAWVSEVNLTEIIEAYAEDTQ